jgi:catechol 2,3-dioxygenase-like lactoylglutathione lyase family enzyme
MARNQTGVLWGHLQYLQIGSPNPERLAQFAYRVLQMTVHQADADWICCAPDRMLIFSPGPAKTLLSAGYAVEDPQVLAALNGRLIRAGITPEAVSSNFFEADAVTFRDPDGNRMCFGRPLSRKASAETLPARLQHVVVASTDAERMTKFYTDVVGMRISDRVLDEQGQLRTAFMRTNDEHHSLAVFQADSCRLDHHCYETTNWNLIRDWADHFSEEGAMVKWGPGRHGPGNNLFVFIHDPDDNWVEISAELVTVPERQPAGIWPHTERSLNLWGRAPLRS